MDIKPLYFNDSNFVEMRLIDIYELMPKTSHKSSRGKKSGKFPFFTNNSDLSFKFVNEFDVDDECIIGNTGGVSYFRYYNGKFSYMSDNIVFKTNQSTKFIYYYLKKLNQKIYYSGFSGSGLKHLDKKWFKKLRLKIPSMMEQEKIGNFLSLFDRLIEKVETKVGLLKELKKGYMQQMFPAKGEKMPKIRFSGFEEDWFEYQLGDISTRITRKNNVDNQNTLTISGSQGLVSQEEYFSKRVASSDLKNYTLIYKNDFAYNKSYSNGYPMGAIKRLNKYEIGVVSSLYICFKLTEKIDNNFIESYFDTGLTNEQLTRVSAEGARNHGLLNISPQDFFSIKISTPDFLEQEKIGDFFKSLDSMIEKQEKELNSIEQLKKGYMQRLFA